LATLPYREHSGTIDVMPEPFDPRMRSAPISLEGFNFRVSEFIRLEFTPGMQAALVPER